MPPVVGGGVDWCASQLVRVICSQIILTANSQIRSLLICYTCPSLKLTTFPFRSSEVRRFLEDLTLMGAPTQWVWPMGDLFLQRTCLSVVFRWLVRLGSFPACRRQANVTPIPKGPPSSSGANYRPISITSVLSKVFELLVSVRLG